MLAQAVAPSRIQIMCWGSNGRATPYTGVLCVQIDMDLLAGGKQPALWSAEEPNLYILVLTLLDKHGDHLDTESAQVIFVVVIILQLASCTGSIAWCCQAGCTGEVVALRHTHVMMFSVCFSAQTPFLSNSLRASPGSTDSGRSEKQCAGRPGGAPAGGD